MNFYKLKLANLTEEYERSLNNYRNLFKVSEEMALKLDLVNINSI